MFKEVRAQTNGITKDFSTVLEIVKNEYLHNKLI